jgi:hypothetical protein
MIPSKAAPVSPQFCPNQFLSIFLWFKQIFGKIHPSFIQLSSNPSSSNSTHISPTPYPHFLVAFGRHLIGQNLPNFHPTFAQPLFLNFSASLLALFKLFINLFFLLNPYY